MNKRQFIDYLEFDFVYSATVPVVVIGRILKRRSTLPFVATGIWGTAAQIIEWSFTINATGVCGLYVNRVSGVGNLAIDTDPGAIFGVTL